MLQIIIAGLIAYGLIRWIEKRQNRKDFVPVGAIVTATLALAFLVTMAILIFELPKWYAIFIYPAYFILPLAILRKMWELSWNRSSAYAGIIFGSIVGTEFVLYFFMYAAGLLD
jgi:hypothetical protein